MKGVIYMFENKVINGYTYATILKGLRLSPLPFFISILRGY